MTKQFQTVTRLGPFQKGAVPETLEITFQDSDGDAINISTYTPEFKIEAVGQTVAGLDAGATALVGGGTAGKCQYTWDAADFTTAGMYRGVMWITRAAPASKLASEVYEWFVEDNPGP